MGVGGIVQTRSAPRIIHLACIIGSVAILFFLANVGGAFAETSAVVQEIQAENGGSWFDRHTSEILILVGSLLGVIIGAIAADRLASRRDHRRDETARKALAGALYQELFHLAIQCYGGCDQMDGYLGRPGEPQSAGMDISILRSFKLPRPTIFEESSSSLGMLPSSLVQRLVAFYIILAFSRDDVDRWDSERAAHTISPRHAKTFAKRWFQLCRLAADALEELCQYLGLPKAANPANPDQDLVALLREKADQEYAR